MPSEIPIMASEIIRGLMRRLFCFWPSRSSSDSDMVSLLETSLLLLLLFFSSGSWSSWSEEEDESGTETTLLSSCFSLVVLEEGREG